jgi:hypothetical protein
VNLFGGHQRKTFIQIKAHLVTKHALGASAGAVGFEDTVGVSTWRMKSSYWERSGRVIRQLCFGAHAAYAAGGNYTKRLAHVRSIQNPDGRHSH